MPGETPKSARYLCAISDASGATAERVVAATLAQFPDVKVDVDLAHHVRTAEEVRRAVEKTRARGGIIVYTLVEPELRREVVACANEAGVATFDLLGPFMTLLSGFLAREPLRRPGASSQALREEHARLDAVAFAVRHDDGLSPQDFPHADLVIVGPSRTSKTPLSVYLAHNRVLKVANVPVALGLPLLPGLKDLGPRRAVGLTMRADLLAEVRRSRLKDLGPVGIAYAEKSHVEEELRYAHELYRSPPAWPVVDVTAKSIEEIAAEVCALTVDAPDYKRPAPGGGDAGPGRPREGGRG